jgi:hypothetical protein
MHFRTWLARIFRLVRLFVAASAAVSFATTAAADETWSAFKFTTGVDYTSGDYGTGTDTDILYIPFSAKYEHGPWFVGLTVPYIRIESDGSVVGGADGTVITKKKRRTKTVGGSTVPDVTTESGLGDIVGQVGRSFFLNHSTLPLVDLIGKIKFPTADEDKGLGTGEFDYSIQADVSKTFGRWTPFGTLGYRYIGEPSGTDLNNIFFASLGAGYKLTEQWSTGLILDYRQSTSDNADDPVELTPSATWKPRRDWVLTGYGVFGATDGGPDYGGGLQASYIWER